MKHDWTDGTMKRWSRLFVYVRSPNILFRNLYFMNLILKTKYTLSTEFVLAQVRGNNHWRAQGWKFFFSFWEPGLKSRNFL